MCQRARFGVGGDGGVVRVGTAPQEVLLAIFEVLLLYVIFGVCKGCNDKLCLDATEREIHSLRKIDLEGCLVFSTSRLIPTAHCSYSSSSPSSERSFENRAIASSSSSSIGSYPPSPLSPSSLIRSGSHRPSSPTLPCRGRPPAREAVSFSQAEGTPPTPAAPFEDAVLALATSCCSFIRRASASALLLRVCCLAS